MFSILSNNGTMGLRLPENDRKEFLQKYKINLMEQCGRIMKEYVEVPPDLLTDSKTLSKYLQKSFDYISILKPKPTRRKQIYICRYNKNK